MNNTETKTGKFLIEKIISLPSYVEITLLNEKLKEQVAIIKDNQKSFLKVYSVKDEVLCRFKIGSNNALEIIQIKKLSSVTKDNFNLKKYSEKFDTLIKSITNEKYVSILKSIFNEEIRELFFLYPFSVDKKRNTPHSLLQHTIEVTEIALTLSKSFDNIDTEILTTASLLHNIGKIQTFEYDEMKKRAFKTDWEDFIGYTQISTLYLSKIMPSEIDQDKAMELYHMILSFNKKMNIVCKTKEAFILRKASEIITEFYEGDF